MISEKKDKKKIFDPRSRSSSRMFVEFSFVFLQAKDGKQVGLGWPS
jgi:hypothetical protein